MAPSYQVRPYKSGDVDGIVDLLQIGFTKWPYFDIKSGPTGHWNWKYLGSSEKSIVVVAEDNDMIVGVGHKILFPVKILEKNILTALSGDTVVHPDYRRRGISNELRKMGAKIQTEFGVRFSYLTTTNPIVVESMSKIRESFPFHIADLVRVRDVDLHLSKNPRDNTWLMKLGYQASALINRMKLGRVEQTSVTDLSIDFVKKFDDGINEFCNLIAPRYDFIIERKKDFLNWRYLDSRAGNYTVLQAADDARHILGYVVVKINRRDIEYPLGYIVDLLTLDTRLDVAEALVNRALEYLDNEGVNIVRSKVVVGHSYEKLYRRYGFIDSREHTNIFYYFIDHEDTLIKLKEGLAERCHFTFADM